MRLYSAGKSSAFRGEPLGKKTIQQGGPLIKTIALRLPATWSRRFATYLLVLVAFVLGAGTVAAQTPTPFKPTGSMAAVRRNHIATLLPNGKVLVAGGYDGQTQIDGAELYDPATGTWSATGSLHTAREQFTATLLPNGKVLVVGGTGTRLNSAELYDPGSGTWSVTGSPAIARENHTATLLANGKVLVAGGD